MGVRKLGTTALALPCLHSMAFAQGSNPPVSQRTHTWWRDRAPGQRPYTTDNKRLPLVAVKGNKFVDPNGNTMLFRGLSISDPDKLEMQGHWLDGLVLRSGVGTDAHPELELRAHPLGRVRQGGHARRDQMTATT